MLRRRVVWIVIVVTLCAFSVQVERAAVSAAESTIISIPDENLHGDVLSAPQIVIDDDGLPALAYVRKDGADHSRVQIIRCDDAVCGGPAEEILSIGLDLPLALELEVTDLVLGPTGNPIIALSVIEQVASADYLTPYLIACNDRLCAGDDESIQQVGEVRSAFGHLSDLGVHADGTVQQILGARGGSPSAAVVVTCFDGRCAPGNTATAVVSQSFVEGVGLALTSAGETVVAFAPSGDSGYDVQIAQCLDTTCATVAEAGVIAGPSVDVFAKGFGFALDNSDAPVIAFPTIELAWCRLAGCPDHGDSGTIRRSLDPDGPFYASHVNLLIDGAGTPAVVLPYYERGLRLLRCQGAECETVANNRLDDRFGMTYSSIGQNVDATIGSDGLPVTAWIGDGQLVVAFCTNAVCGAQTTCDGFPVTVDLEDGQSPTPQSDVIQGTSGDDVIAAGAGDDVICGNAGNDRIWGQSGTDLIIGSAGDDHLRGGSGGDNLRGGSGQDDLAGGQGNDLLFGGDGDDIIRGGTGDDRVSGGRGSNPLLSGNGGADVVTGGIGEDKLVGGPRPDSLYGYGGDDLLKGNNGADSLFGGPGDDELFGGPGGDWLVGESGVDLCNGGTTGAEAGEFDVTENCELEINVP